MSLVALYFYHFMRYVLCLERLALYFSRFVFAFFALVTSQTPAYFCVGRYTLRLNQNSSQDLHAYFLSCELFFFFSQLLLCLVVVLQFFSRAFLLSQVELYIGCMFYLVREFACCTEFCVLTRKQVVEVVILFVVLTCNSFEVLSRVMFELMVSRDLAYQ